MKRNYSIDLLKFYFAITIAIGHAPFGASFPVISSGKVVMLFFVLSGYFLVGSFLSGKYSSAGQYSVRRISRIYPYYLFSFIAQFVYLQALSGNGLRNAVLSFFRSLPELLFLSGTGLFDVPLNYPVWHICCLIVASHIFFGLLIWNRQLTLDVICPVLALLSFTYLTMDDVDMMGRLGNFLYVPMMRAAGGIALGMFLYPPIQKILKTLESSTLPELPLLVSVSAILLALVLWTNRMTFALIFPFIGILICFLYPKSIYARLSCHPRLMPLLSRLDKLSLVIYMNHALIVRIFEQFPKVYTDISFIPPDFLLMVAVFLYCIASIWLVDRITAYLSRFWKRYFLQTSVM